MRLRELFEGVSDQRVVVVYGGRFQPFHKGHYKAYQWLCKKFGVNNVWIATSNKTNFDPKKGDVSPFTFKEKREIMVALYDIDPARIVQCKNPTFKPTEVFAKYKNVDVTYVSVVGAKDVSRYEENSYFLKLPGGYSDKNAYELDTMEDGHAYYVVAPMTERISGTEARNALMGSEDHDEIFRKYFGRYSSVIDGLVSAKLKDVKLPPPPKPEEEEPAEEPDDQTEEPKKKEPEKKPAKPVEKKEPAPDEKKPIAPKKEQDAA